MAFLMTRISFSITGTLSAQRRGFILFFLNKNSFFLKSQQNTFQIHFRNLIIFSYLKSIIGRVNNFHRHTFKKERKKPRRREKWLWFRFLKQRIFQPFVVDWSGTLDFDKSIFMTFNKTESSFRENNENWTPLLWIFSPW